MMNRCSTPRFHRLLRTFAAALALTFPLHAQDDEPVPPDEIPWQFRLGLRAEAVEKALTVIDRVVLVPDTATWLDELSKWSLQGRWPVLIEDDRYAATFIRRFEPQQVVRRDSIGALPPDRQALQDQLTGIIVGAWSGLPDESPREAFERHSYTPPGVVITSTDDPAWTAAIALAAGRGQPLLFLDERFGRPGGALDEAQFTDLRDRVNALLQTTGYRFDGTGDDIDALTICRTLSGKVDIQLPESATPQLNGAGFGPPYAVTDMLGRDDEWQPWAATGWIFGDEIRSAYVAMCSLFLPREMVQFYHTYPDSGEWKNYDPHSASQALQAKGFTSRIDGRGDSQDDRWLRMIAGGLGADVIVMHTQGGPAVFQVPGGQGHANDVPVLNVPSAIHFTHSWSLAAPDIRETVGGRWLEHGAYAYVGSVDEPYLGAFVPPEELARRWTNHAPFLLSGRHAPPHPLANPWKINTIGDPLMQCLPPEDQQRPRVAPPAVEAPETTLLNDAVKDAMRRAADESAAPEDYAQAIRMLGLLGKDDIAAKLWQASRQRDKASEEVARAALGPLFREQEPDEFISAWRVMSSHEPWMRDMLWHLVGPQLPSTQDEDLLLTMQQELRRPMVHVDLQRLGPHLARAFGRVYVHKLLEREMGDAIDGNVLEELKVLRRRF